MKLDGKNCAVWLAQNRDICNGALLGLTRPPAAIGPIVVPAAR